MAGQSQHRLPKVATATAMLFPDRAEAQHMTHVGRTAAGKEGIRELGMMEGKEGSNSCGIDRTMGSISLQMRIRYYSEIIHVCVFAANVSVEVPYKVTYLVAGGAGRAI